VQWTLATVKTRLNSRLTEIPKMFGARITFWRAADLVIFAVRPSRLLTHAALWLGQAVRVWHMTSRANAIEFINRVHEKLSDQTDLSPNNPIVTHWAKRFVEFLGATYRENWANHLPDAPELAKATAYLPVLCGRAV
jgi:hypothetical protein